LIKVIGAGQGINDTSSAFIGKSPMTVATVTRHARPVPSIALIPYVLITFAVTWGLVAFYIFEWDLAVSWFGEISGRHPIFILAVWGPAIAAFAVVVFFGGVQGFTAYLSRLTLWRSSLGWVAFLLIGIPLIFAAGSLMKGNLTSNAFPFDSLGATLGAMAFMLILGPIEEFGWRGLAQPILQRHMAPIWAGLVIGTAWGIWHIPAFYLSGTVQSTWEFWPFFFGNVALAVIVTPLFNIARGSIVLPMLFHYQLINPLWPDAQPYDTYIVIAVAVLVVWLNRKTMFTRAGAVTEVIPGSGG
jgi:membrane protease YdiL (CAAX protease family)